MCSNANYYTHYAFLPSTGEDQALQAVKYNEPYEQR